MQPDSSHGGPAWEKMKLRMDPARTYGACERSRRPCWLGHVIWQQALKKRDGDMASYFLIPGLCTQVGG